MRAAPFIAPLAVVLAIAGSAVAQPADVVVTLGPDLQDKVEELGAREVGEQADALAEAVRVALSRQGALEGARVELVLTDLKPNRPTWQQTIDRPGLDSFASISIGGASIEGEVILADGTRRPVEYERYSHNLTDVVGYSTWQDADQAFNTFARRLAGGRL